MAAQARRAQAAPLRRSSATTTVARAAAQRRARRSDARAPPRRGRQVRRRRLPGLPRAAPDLRGDHGDAGLRALERDLTARPSSTSCRPSATRRPGGADERAPRLGISHKTAPVALRERLALTEAGAPSAAARAATRSPSVHEAVAISTCNRTEVYLVVDDPVAAETRGARAARARGAASARPSSPSVIYSPRNCDAARHLFRVTAGLESMIVGEAEVQGQVRRAYELRSRPAPPAR